MSATRVQAVHTKITEYRDTAPLNLRYRFISEKKLITEIKTTPIICKTTVQ